MGRVTTHAKPDGRVRALLLEMREDHCTGNWRDSAKCHSSPPICVENQSRECARAAFVAGSVGRDELAKRADDFGQGHWTALVRDSSGSGAKICGARWNNQQERCPGASLQGTNRVESSAGAELDVALFEAEDTVMADMPVR